jgi:hypothetical protein
MYVYVKRWHKNSNLFSVLFPYLGHRGLSKTVKSPPNVSSFKVLPHLALNFYGPSPIISELNYFPLKFSLV